MNRVDIADHLQANFTTKQQTSRIWMPLFYYLLDTAICNAYLLSEHHCKSQLSYNPKKRIRGTHQAFCKTLIDALLLQYKAGPTRIYTNARNLPTSRLDWPYDLYKKMTISYCGRCHFCCFRKDMLENQLGNIVSVGSTKVRQTQVMCRHCNVYLCAKCFLFVGIHALTTGTNITALRYVCVVG
jgi:hypothetical protein